MENKERPKTKSRNFYDDEIHGVLPDGTIYLKEGVYRFYPPYNSESYQNINYEALINDKVENIKNMLDSEKNFE